MLTSDCFQFYDDFMRPEQVNLLRTKCPPIGQAFRPKDNSTTHSICGLFLSRTQLVSRRNWISNVFMTKTRGPSWIEKKNNSINQIDGFFHIEDWKFTCSTCQKSKWSSYSHLKKKRDSGVASFTTLSNSQTENVENFIFSCG